MMNLNKFCPKTESNGKPITNVHEIPTFIGITYTDIRCLGITFSEDFLEETEAG